jgi:hypothetical protein
VQEFGNAWSLSLELVTAANQHCGNLTVFRSYVNRDLQLDINLLTTAFPATLAEALHRTATQNIEFIPAPQKPALVSAQAG